MAKPTPNQDGTVTVMFRTLNAVPWIILPCEPWDHTGKAYVAYECQTPKRPVRSAFLLASMRRSSPVGDQVYFDDFIAALPFPNIVRIVSRITADMQAVYDSRVANLDANS